MEDIETKKAQAKRRPWSSAVKCSCGSVEHTQIWDVFEDEGDVWVTYQLDAPGFWKRLKLCAKLLAGWKILTFEAVLDKDEVNSLLMYLDPERGP
mgnify:CR=1 FL=1